MVFLNLRIFSKTVVKQKYGEKYIGSRRVEGSAKIYKKFLENRKLLTKVPLVHLKHNFLLHYVEFF